MLTYRGGEPIADVSPQRNLVKADVPGSELGVSASNIMGPALAAILKAQFSVRDVRALTPPALCAARQARHLRASGKELPDLVFDLHDAPLTKVIVNMQGAKKSRVETQRHLRRPLVGQRPSGRPWARARGVVRYLDARCLTNTGGYARMPIGARGKCSAGVCKAYHPSSNNSTSPRRGLR
jgi:hypothetical protein